MTVRVRHLGLVDYRQTWQRMQQFTDRRDDDTADEIWFLQHPAVFTLGRNGKPEHLLDTRDIPVLQVDRGGQVTYHAPGQLVVYVLLNLRRRGLGVRALVTLLEDCVIELLSDYGIEAHARADAPGVYVNDAKIAALGLRVRKGCCFHGLALNVDLDLAPFEYINPCGFQGLRVSRLCDYIADVDFDAVSQRLQHRLVAALS